MIQNLLYQPKTMIVHPNPQVYNLTAWSLPRYFSKIGDFHLKLEKLKAASWRKETRMDYAATFCKFNSWFSWCRERKYDPHLATLAQ